MPSNDYLAPGEHDDDLRMFEAIGAAPLPEPTRDGVVKHEGAAIRYAAFGAGPPVVLLHGGLGHGGNWGYQVPMLIEAGLQPVVVDSRGHGRSTRDAQPYSYDLMARDLIAVLDVLEIARTPVIGWSDGACTALALARRDPGRVSGILFFACNVDGSGTRPFEPTEVIDRCFARHKADYAALSATPDNFDAFVADVGLMQRTQPEYSAQDLAGIGVPVTVVQSESDEFIKAEHAEYLARTLPRAELVVLRNVTHFAPLQRPEVFNAAIRDFLSALGS